MNSRLYLENYLNLLKSTVEVYVHGTLESSNNSIRKLLKSGLDDTMNNQANTYDKITELGWYNVQNIESKKIKQVVTKVCTEN